MCPIGYYEMMRNCKDPRLLRLKMVQYAQEKGNKRAAEVFRVQVKTVRKWRRRYESEGYAGLVDRSRAPHRPSQKISTEERKAAIAYKRKYRTFGALRIKHLFSLPMSEKAIRRIWRDSGICTRRRRKHQTKNDLREIKQQWRLFEQSCVDTKHLSDIPEYWPQMKRYRLPLYQYTFREVVSGLQFLGYGSECSITYATLFARTVLDHLSRCGVDLSGCRIQTDNGSEFIGSWQARHESIFTQTIASIPGLIHTTIPVAAHRWQADVETVHHLIEDEFYCVETFSSRREFFLKAATYLLWFNTVRPNSSKAWKSPWHIIHERNTSIPPQIAFLSPVMLDECFSRQNALLSPFHALDDVPLRGYDVILRP